MSESPWSNGTRLFPRDYYWPRPNGQDLETKSSDPLNHIYMEKIKAKCYVEKMANGPHYKN